MASKTKRVSRLSTKKKKWYGIVTPKFLGGKEVGETHLSEPEEAVGRTVKVNLMQISGDIKTQNINVKFQITGFKDNKLRTEMTGYYYLPSSIKRLIRRRMTRVDDSIVLFTKDKKRIRIKPLLITRGKVSRSVDRALRSALKEELTKFIGKSTYEEAYASIIQNNIQNEIRKKFSTIYPVRTVLIRTIEKEPEEKRSDEQEPEKPAIKKEAPKEVSKEEKEQEKEETKEEKKQEKPKEEKKETKNKPKKKKAAKKTKKKSGSSKKKE